MNCILIVIAFVFYKTKALSDPLADDIIQYFKSDSVKTLKRIWTEHKESIEHAIEDVVMNETQADNLTEYGMKPSDLRLSTAYYHKHGPVEVVFENLDLKELPRSLLPFVSLILNSNLLQIETALSKMVINAEYILMRNKSDIITDVVNQDLYKYSPFLLTRVLNKGHVTIYIESCFLSGYVIAKLKRETVALGHDKFTLTRCAYTLEIYNKKSKNAPLVVRYSVKRPAYTFGIKHFLLKAIRKKFIAKLQSALLKTINTSAIFGRNLLVYAINNSKNEHSTTRLQDTLRKEQNILFNKTLSILTIFMKYKNEQMKQVYRGAVHIPDYVCTWDYYDFSPLNEVTEPAHKKLQKMVLSGLDNATYSLTGGPYKLNRAMIGEQISFNKLQVTGEVPLPSQNENNYHKFSVNIYDFAINIDIDVETKGSNHAKAEIVGYSRIEFEPTRTKSVPLQTLIIGYLMDEVPKAIVKTMAAITNMPPNTKPNSGLSDKDRKNNAGFAKTKLTSTYKQKTYEHPSNNEI